MWKTVILLLLSIVLVPLLTWRLDIIPSDLQWDIIRQTYALCLGMALLCFLVSNLSRNYSQVDKLWSIMPVVYAWMIYGQAPDRRILLMAILISIWGMGP